MTALLARAWADWLHRWRVTEPVALPPLMYLRRHEAGCDCVDCVGRL